MVVSVSFPIQMALSASSVREGESAQVKTQKDTAAGISCYQSFTTTTDRSHLYGNQISY